jgi:HAD superfamily hydrolase (TIGR01549 family)
MTNSKIISFDLDGTLTNLKFADSVWLEGIPRLYSISKAVSFNYAKEAVKREYDKIGKERLEWYNLVYWIRKFDLNITPQQLLRDFESRIAIFPEVPRVLSNLNEEGFELIIVTNARREFAELELGKAEIENHFKHVFSATSDFGLLKNTVNLYKRICSILEIAPEEMIHVGDDLNFDFNVPRKLGILAFQINRTGKHKGEYVINNLEELKPNLAHSEENINELGLRNI